MLEYIAHTTYEKVVGICFVQNDVKQCDSQFFWNTTKADKGGFEKRCISLTKGTLFKQWKTMIVSMFCILFILHMIF